MTDDLDDEPQMGLTQEIEIAGGQLIEWVRQLVRDDSVRQIRIKAPGGHVLLDTSVERRVMGDGAMPVAAPWLAIVGSLAALVSRVKVEIVRDVQLGGGDVPQSGEVDAPPLN